MENTPVKLEIRKTLGIIRIDNPPVNALSQAVRSGILDALREAEESCEGILIICDGNTFIAGADISEFGRPPVEPHLPDVLNIIEKARFPVVAAMHKNALGGGLELAMAAHYRCASPGTRLGLPEVNLGLIPGAGGTQRLPRLVGVERALDMIISGKPISAEAAHSMSLVDELFPGDLFDSAVAYAQGLIEEKRPARPTSSLTAQRPENADYFKEYRKSLKSKFRGQIAPGFVLNLVELATSADMEAGLLAERARFIECKGSEQSAALRHAFFAERASAGLPGITKEASALPVDSVAVIGAGTMGSGIAMCFASAGIPVTLVETSNAFLEKGLATITGNYDGSVSRGRITPAQAHAAQECISGTTDYADLGQVDLVIEAVFESMEVKKEVFRKLDKVCKPSCILATNTSYLDVNEIASVTGRPSRVIGAHFFSPANVMKLLEVVRADATAPEVVKTFMDLAKRIAKIPVSVGVCHGFVGNRMLRAYARQAQLMLLEGASPSQIDDAAQDWGMAMGPLAVADLAGLDISYRSRRDQGIEPYSVKEFTLGDRLVVLGRLGQKSGAGYYKYDMENRGRVADPDLEPLIAEVATQWNVQRREIGPEEIVDRLMLALVNEGAAIVREGIAARPSDVDVVYMNGYGFPRWRGGPMFYADNLGLEAIVSGLFKLEELTGDSFWKPDQLLLSLLEQRETFSSLNK